MLMNIKWMFLLLAAINANLLYAANYDDRLIQRCTSTELARERLACFDELFGTPVYLTLTANHALSFTRTASPTTYLILQQEQERPADSFDLIMTSRLEHEDTAQQRVVLSTPAIGAVAYGRPVFALSCIDKITRLQIILPQEVLEARAVVTVRDEKNRQLLSDRWQVIDNGYVVDAGRGIPSIRIAQKLKRHKRISLESNLPVLDGLTFDLEKLSEYVVPLAKACQWRG